MRTAILVVVGVFGALAAAFGVQQAVGRSSAAFGWTAYSPLSAEAYPVLLQPPWWALVLIVLGSAAAGAALALLLAGAVRRRISAGGDARR